jgi:hypothetical protein
VPLAVRVLLAFAIYTHVGEQVLTVPGGLETQ